MNLKSCACIMQSPNKPNAIHPIDTNQSEHAGHRGLAPSAVCPDAQPDFAQFRAAGHPGQ